MTAMNEVNKDKTKVAKGTGLNVFRIVSLVCFTAELNE